MKPVLAFFLCVFCCGTRAHDAKQRLILYDLAHEDFRPRIDANNQALFLSQLLQYVHAVAIAVRGRATVEASGGRGRVR